MFMFLFLGYVYKLVLMSGQLLIVLLHLTKHETRHKVINDSRITYLYNRDHCHSWRTVD